MRCLESFPPVYNTKQCKRKKLCLKEKARRNLDVISLKKLYLRRIVSKVYRGSVEEKLWEEELETARGISWMVGWRIRGRHLSASEQPGGMGNALEKSKQTDGSGKKELIKGGRDTVVCISKALGLYIFKGS